MRTFEPETQVQIQLAPNLIVSLKLKLHDKERRLRPVAKMLIYNCKIMCTLENES